MKKFMAVLAAVMFVAVAVPALAATNPFMDVPANHWAYDAVSQLASRGVISGYPDGSYKGAQPATRYEMASVVARALAKIDIEKANKADVETLKKLIVEFKDELDALGVKLDKLDARVAVIEKDLGGWSLAGELRFDARSTSGNYLDQAAPYNARYNQLGRNEFDLNRYRIFLRRRIDENTNFTARLGDGWRAGHQNTGNRPVFFERYYVTANLPYDVRFIVGRNNYDWENELKLRNGLEEDSWVGDWTLNAFDFKKSWGIIDAELLIGRTDGRDNAWVPGLFTDATATPTTAAIDASRESYTFGLKLNANFNERFRAGLLGYWWYTDTAWDQPIPGTVNGYYSNSDYDTKMWGIYAGFKFTPEVELKGVYYSASNGDLITTTDGGNNNTLRGESAKAWKAILDVKQEALKFTSLWIEYGNVDNNFRQGINPTFNTHAYGGYGVSIFNYVPNDNNTSKVIFVRADQQWNDKWRTYLRYNSVDPDTANRDTLTNWTFGVGYRYSPAIEFELAYDHVDFGNNYRTTGNNDGDDHLVRFRTYVTF
ncbi:S-layer protein [Synergistales bacterium]|nr:S-layer protein [Synergistales bacterium]